jgi:hypothetical protein
VCNSFVPLNVKSSTPYFSFCLFKYMLIIFRPFRPRYKPLGEKNVVAKLNVSEVNYIQGLLRKIRISLVSKTAPMLRTHTSFVYHRDYGILYTLHGFKTSDDAFRLSYSIAFDCSIRPFLDLFHSWLYIFHLSRFSGNGLVFSFLQVSSES